MMNSFERRSMHKRILGVALMLAFAVLLAGAKHDFQRGKLINIDSEETLINGTSFRSAILKVEVGGVVYSARGERMRRHSGDLGHGLIIGDPVQAAIDGETLILLKPDGKELKAKITRRERAQ
jgi:hypothetical protein